MNRLPTYLLKVLIAIMGLTIPAAHAQSRLIADEHNGVRRIEPVLISPPATMPRPAPLSFSLMPPSRNPFANKSNIAASGASLQVLGSGTTGRVTKFTGMTNFNSFVGDSTIFEDKNGLVGIGTDAPSSKLTVAGMIQITLGGLKFPDGSIQTTSAAGTLTTVTHDMTLIGSGTTSSPLGVASPLMMRDLDNPARQPIQTSAGCDAETGIITPCEGDLYTVPDGKRFVIEFISTSAFPFQGVKVILQISTTVNFRTVRYFFNNVTESVAQPLRLYADPATTVRFNIIRIEPITSASFEVAISGYLVDIP